MTAREAILEIVKDKFKHRLRLGIVKAGSVAAGLCTVIPFDSEDVNGVGSEILEVRIQANPGNGIKPTPTDGSIVLIGEIAPFDYAILMYSALDSITFMDGSLGGLVQVVALTTKLNNLENLVNDLISKYNVHTHPVSGASTGVPVIPEPTTLTPTVRANIENSKITHG